MKEMKDIEQKWQIMKMECINVREELCLQHPSVLVTELMPPPIEIQEMIFILKIIEFFVPEKLLLLIFIKRALGNIANNLIQQPL